MTPVSLALDIGATKIAAGLVPDAHPTEVHHNFRVPTQGPGLNPKEQILSAIRQAHATAEEHGMCIVRIGVGAPGIVRGPEGIITYNGDTLKNWAGTNLRELNPLPCPLAAHNDVRIMAYGEYHLGAGQTLPKEARILVVSLGTGAGGAIIDHGELLPGPTGAAGEISEIRCADLRGLATRCENTVSGTGLARYYNVLRRKPDTMEPIPWALRGEGELSLEEITSLKDQLCDRIIYGNCFGFGEALGALASAWDLSAIIVGGGVAELGEYVLGPLREGVRAAALSPLKEIPVIRAQLGSAAPLIGAACYARHHDPEEQHS